MNVILPWVVAFLIVQTGYLHYRVSLLKDQMSGAYFQILLLTQILMSSATPEEKEEAEEPKTESND